MEMPIGDLDTVSNTVSAFQVRENFMVINSLSLRPRTCSLPETITKTVMLNSD